MNLPELKTGDLLISPAGRTYQVKRMRKPRRDTGYEEPRYRLQRLMLTGNREWTLEELEEAGLQLFETTETNKGE